MALKTFATFKLSIGAFEKRRSFALGLFLPLISLGYTLQLSAQVDSSAATAQVESCDTTCNSLFATMFALYTQIETGNVDRWSLSAQDEEAGLADLELKASQEEALLHSLQKQLQLGTFVDDSFIQNKLLRQISAIRSALPDMQRSIQTSHQVVLDEKEDITHAESRIALLRTSSVQLSLDHLDQKSMMQSIQATGEDFDRAYRIQLQDNLAAAQAGISENKLRIRSQEAEIETANRSLDLTLDPNDLVHLKGDLAHAQQRRASLTARVVDLTAARDKAFGDLRQVSSGVRVDLRDGAGNDQTSLEAALQFSGRIFLASTRDALASAQQEVEAMLLENHSAQIAYHDAAQSVTSVVTEDRGQVSQLSSEQLTNILNGNYEVTQRLGRQRDLLLAEKSRIEWQLQTIDQVGAEHPSPL